MRRREAYAAAWLRPGRLLPTKGLPVDDETRQYKPAILANAGDGTW